MFQTAAMLRVLAVLLLAGPAWATPPEQVRFNRDVRPILSQNCWSCHGPAKRRGGLRLDSAEAATRKPKGGGAAVVPGQPDASELVRRIFTADPDEAMPPAETHKTLTHDQKETLRRWVAQGAVFEPHWSFVKVTAPPIPSAGPDVRNPVDAFVNDRLRRAGLTPNPEADRPTLFRRLAFALTGLPPTPAEVDAFVNDRSPDAYEQLVNRYLQSPHYGEEMARHWLDLARYADTHGLHLDNVRTTWPYRDWVVDAFNTNKRFDQFTIEQLAGDLLPNPTTNQLVATGFNRCNVTTGEGGSIESEWYFRNAVDRASVAAQTWLGLTAGCAVCHDHKFDPLSQKEFYGLYAFFYSAAGPALDGNVAAPEPSLKLTTPEQARRLAAMAERISKLNADIDAKTKALAYADPADVVFLTGPAPMVTADVTKSFRAWARARGGPAKDKLPQEIKQIFAVKDGKWNPAQQGKLREYYLRTVCVTTKEPFTPLIADRDRVTAERTKLDASIPATMIFRDAPTPRQAFVMLRGQYDKPAEKVTPGVPAVLPPLPPTPRATRLDLAKWVVSPANPLTARVFVNRVWQQMFGTGLVKTSDDFGAQGEPPSHPELLDWLAADFRDRGWDVQALVRRLVTSAAFRRSATVVPAVLARDPENRLYARGPRFRLDAEQIRDNALFVAGLLDRTVGGPGVKPYQPANIWEPVGFTGSNTQFYKRDSGSALYRRTLYTFFKRTAPAPYLSNFDMPNREQSCSRRDRSDTPLQALQLMNDVQHVEAARGLAERMLTEGGTTPADRITFAFRVVLARRPAPDELAIVAEQLAAHRARYAQNEADAKKLIAQGESKPNPVLPPAELAAYALVANMLLNLDETVTRN